MTKQYQAPSTKRIEFDRNEYIASSDYDNMDFLLKDDLFELPLK